VKIANPSLPTRSARRSDHLSNNPARQAISLAAMQSLSNPDP